MKRWVIFAERDLPGRFAPLDWLRPAFMLRNGAWTIAERWITLLQPQHVSCVVRPWIGEALTEETGWSTDDQIQPSSDDEIWLIVGAVSPVRDDWQEQMENDSDSSDWRWSKDGSHLIRMSGSSWNKIRSEIRAWLQPGDSSDCPIPLRQDADPCSLFAAQGLWDLVHHLDRQLRFDWAVKRAGASETMPVSDKMESTTVVLGRENVCFGRGVSFSPHVMIDATAGPVVLDENVSVESFTHLIGPAHIGTGSVLLGGKFSGGTAIGPGCKIAGEWEQSIAQGFTNKAHAGFFGHGFLGEWVNLGAMTTNSDLKNTYGTVRVARDGEPVDTGLSKVGSFIGDHTKTGIGTLIPTGATMGVGVNVAGGGLSPKDIPSFLWLVPGAESEHRIDKMLATSAVVVKRRDALLRSVGRPEHLTDAQCRILRTVFEHTQVQREQWLRDRH